MDNTVIKLLSEINQRLRSLNLAQKPFFTLKEAELFTGFSPSRLYKATREKELPYFKNHGRVYFKKDDLEAWLLQNRVSSTDEIDESAINYLVNK